MGLEPDLQRLEELAALALPEAMSLQETIVAEVDGAQILGVLVKRTYSITGDACVLSPEDEQEPLFDRDVPYAVVDPPLVSPIAIADDTCALKGATDVVVQGDVFAGRKPATEVIAEVRFKNVERRIRATGDRRGDFNAGGQAVFSDPEPFEEMPLRYDYAYGGCDSTALERYGFPGAEEIDFARPDYGIWARTPYHYPRNPAGCGYLVELDRESFEGLAIPNLEHADQPLTPKRLAVGSAERWITGPLPAALDWQAADWFPRMAYLGFLPDHDGLEGKPPQEVKLGWARRDVLETKSILEDVANARAEFAQAASPGMAIDGVAPDETFLLVNLHPRRRNLRVTLAGEVPETRLTLPDGVQPQLVPHLNSVVLRPADERVTVVWYVRAALPRRYAEHELAELEPKVIWRRR